MNKMFIDKKEINIIGINKEAFSLTEVFVALLIASIMMAAAAPFITKKTNEKLFNIWQQTSEGESIIPINIDAIAPHKIISSGDLTIQLPNDNGIQIQDDNGNEICTIGNTVSCNNVIKCGSEDDFEKLKCCGAQEGTNDCSAKESCEKWNSVTKMCTN